MKLLASALALLVASCGSSDGGLPGGGSVKPVTTCNPLAFAMLNTANSDAKVCNATVACIDSQCADTALECAGPNYKAGAYTGTCGGYLTCVKGCNCDKACVDKCDPGTIECAECLSTKLAMGCTLKCVSEIASCGKK